MFLVKQVKLGRVADRNRDQSSILDRVQKSDWVLIEVDLVACLESFHHENGHDNQHKNVGDGQWQSCRQKSHWEDEQVQRVLQEIFG